MKIARLETFLTNAGVRNYLFVRLTTDAGLTGIGEASLEWQERAVEVLLNDWVAARVVGKDPFDVEEVVGGMIRDQYQGGSTVMTAISGVEIAMWDLIGKACRQPVYRLIGGRAHKTIHAYANGWYGGCRTPVDCATRASAVAARGYTAIKFDPFTTAWKTLTRDEEDAAVAIVEAVANSVGPKVGLIIEIHGRLAAAMQSASFAG
jgi:galactonate dehydratase